MKICDKVKRYQWAEEALQELREELDRLVRNGYSIPVEPGAGGTSMYARPTIPNCCLILMSGRRKLSSALMAAG
ncbi:hypothetical protein N6H14_00240 [Paenibacillus sp. CC-CFT747]|nr:hypothetical protein N6H14_00240 [Paenibacillus sp. CC-CFT747]